MCACVTRSTKAWSSSATQTTSEIHAEVCLNWHKGKFSRFFYFRGRVFLIFFRSLFEIVLAMVS